MCVVATVVIGDPCGDLRGELKPCPCLDGGCRRRILPAVGPSIRACCRSRPAVSARGALTAHRAGQQLKEGVESWPAVAEVDVGPAVEVVVTGFAPLQVVLQLAIDGIVAVAALTVVVTLAQAQDVRAAKAVDVVVAGIGPDEVPPWAADEDVGEVVAVDDRPTGRRVGRRGGLAVGAAGGDQTGADRRARRARRTPRRSARRQRGRWRRPPPRRRGWCGA